MRSDEKSSHVLTLKKENLIIIKGIFVYFALGIAFLESRYACLVFQFPLIYRLNEGYVFFCAGEVGVLCWST